MPAPECAHRGSASCLHADGDGTSVPAAGDFWNAPAGTVCVSGSGSCPDGGGGCIGGSSGSGGACKSRAASVAYVLNSESGPAESAALQCLKDACDAAGCRLDVVQFGKLDFGEMAVLDQFYNAGGSLLSHRADSERTPGTQEPNSRSQIPARSKFKHHSRHFFVLLSPRVHISVPKLSFIYLKLSDCILFPHVLKARVRGEM